MQNLTFAAIWTDLTTEERETLAELANVSVPVLALTRIGSFYNKITYMPGRSREPCRCIGCSTIRSLESKLSHYNRREKMNKSLERHVVTASDATEALIKRLPDMPLDEKVDIAARLRAVVKNCGLLDKAIKTDIKKKLKGKDGTVLGDLFKANLTNCETTRFQTAEFKIAHPELYEEWCETTTEGRVTFEPR